jgi:hypothetical protein
LKTQGSKCEDPLKIFIESFYIYMYSVSIVWMIIMYVMITIAKREERLAIKKSVKKFDLISDEKEVS